MESSYARPRRNRPPPISIPRNTAPAPRIMSPTPTMLRAWAKDKLSMVPSMYSKYDEGMKALKDLIQQEFAPQYHSIAMQAFYKEFYTIGADSTETGFELWSRWRHNHQKQVSGFMGFHTSTNYNTTELEDGISSFTGYDRRAALDLPTGTSRSADATMERQLRTSALISEVEAKLLRNRDSNYWGDLATPILPQGPGKVKVVYIRPKSSRHTINPEDQNDGIDSNDMTNTLSESVSKNHRRNSLPPLGTSSTKGSSTMRGFVENVPALGRFQVPLGEIKGTISQEIIPTTFSYTERALPTLVAPLRFKVPNSDNFPLNPPPLTATVEYFHKQSRRSSLRANNFANGVDNFRTGVDGSLDSLKDRTTRAYDSQSQRLLDTPVPGTSNESGEKMKYLQRTSSKALNFLGPKNALQSPVNNRELVTKVDDNESGIRWADRSLLVQKVHQGHDILGLHSPVESFIASPNKNSPVTEQGRPNTQKIPGSIACLIPISTPIEAPSPSSVYPSSSNISCNSPGTVVDANAKNIPPNLQDSPKNNPGGLHKNKVNQCNSSDYSRRVTFDSEINENYAYSGAQKLRSRFSFVLPQIPVGSRPAYISHRRSSMQPSGLRVTKEVTQEEEKDPSGKFNRSTFTAHVPRFGKDPMKEIHKAHTRGDTKKPAFLRVIQDAVHDGINITRKSPPKVNNLEYLKPPSKYPGRSLNRMVISSPIHDGNPLKISSSTSTPNILLTALPIPKATPISNPSQSEKRYPNTGSLNLGEKKTPAIVLLPWEPDDVSMGEDGSLSDENENIVQYTPKDAKASKKVITSPAITIDPFQQAALYSWIECSVVQACSDFLKQQQTSLNLDLLKKEVKKWRNEEIKFSTGEVRKRDQPLEFMFGMEVQCRLVEGSYKALVFSGPSAMNPTTIITAWKHIIPSFSPRTFCFPDYLVLEHLRVIEKVLHLFGPAYWDNKLYEKKRAEIVTYIIDSGQARKTRSAEEKMEKLQKEREKAEAQLLMEAGIWSTEKSTTGSEFEG